MTKLISSPMPTYCRYAMHITHAHTHATAHAYTNAYLVPMPTDAQACSWPHPLVSPPSPPATHYLQCCQTRPEGFDKDTNVLDLILLSSYHNSVG